MGPKGIDRALEAGKDPNADLSERSAKERETQTEMAVALRIRGASYTQIARIAEYSSPTHARSAVERALASTAESPEERERMRVLVDKRLNRLLSAVMTKALDEDSPEQLAFNARALAIVDRQAKLWGLDAPTQVQITPSDQHIQDYINRVRQLANADSEAVEAEILEEAGYPDGQEGDIG